MTLLDSSVWIEYLTQGPRIAGREDLFSEPGNILVSTINLYEVGRYVLRTSGQEIMEEVLVNMGRCHVRAVDRDVAHQGILLAARYRLPMADALIAATARLHDAALFTLDEDLLKVPGARAI